MIHKAIYALSVVILGTALPFPVVNETLPNTFNPLAAKMKDFSNCQEAADWINSGAEQGNTTYGYDTDSTPITLILLQKGGVAASATLSWTYNAQTSHTTLAAPPQWSNMTAADKSAVEEYEAALRAHEEGHQKVAKDFMATATERVTAIGPTAGEATQNLKVKAKKHRKMFDENLEKKEKEYDRITNHGRNQAAIGGKNVTLNCP